MQLRVSKNNNLTIAELISDRVVIDNVQDALDLIDNANYKGVRNIVVNEKDVSPDFFNLKTRLAGEIMQEQLCLDSPQEV